MLWFFESFYKMFDLKSRSHKNELRGFLAIHFLTLFIVLFMDSLLNNFFISLTYLFISTIVFFSLIVRRLNDIPLSKLYLFLFSNPITNLFLCVYLMGKEGQQQQNQFGPVPRDFVDI